MKNTETKNILVSLQALILYAVIFLVPLTFFPFIHQQFTWAKTAVIQSAATSLILLGLMRLLSGDKMRLHLGASGMLIALFILWQMLLWPFAESVSLAGERIALVGSVLALAWFWNAYVNDDMHGAARLTRALSLLVVSATIVSIWALMQDVLAKTGALPGLRPFFAVGQNYLGDWRGNVTASFGNTDFIAAFLATLFLPTVLLYLHVPGRLHTVLTGTALFLMTSALIVCWSVGANGALILTTLVMLFFLRLQRIKHIFRKASRRLVAFGVLCVIAVLWFVTPNPLNPHNSAEHPGIFQEAFGSKRWIEGGPTRWIIWLNTLSIIQEKPLLGAGPGNFTYAYPRQSSVFIPEEPEWQRYVGTYTNAAHNMILQVWAETGAVGATLLVLIVAATLFRIFQAAKPENAEEIGEEMRPILACAMGAGFLVLCLDGMMTFPLQLPTLLMLFFLLIASTSFLAFKPENVVDVILPLGRSSLESTGTGGRFGHCRFAMKDMRKPVGVEIELRLPKIFQAVVLILAFVAGAYFMVWTWRLIVADASFLKAKRTFSLINRTAPEQVPREALEYTLRNALEAARAAPRHHDAWGVAGQMQLRLGQPQAALDSFEHVFRRLDSREYYLHRAQGYQALGRDEEALRDYGIYQSRLPEM